MSEIDSGGPAFPMSHEQMQTGIWGLTKREWFAGLALQGMIDSDADVDPEFVGILGKWGDVVAKRAFLYADAMIKAGEMKK